MSFLFSFTVNWPLQPFGPCAQLETVSVPELSESNTCRLVKQAFESDAQTSWARTFVFLKVYVSYLWAVGKSSFSFKERSWDFPITPVMTLSIILQSPVSTDLRKIHYVTIRGLQQKY